MQSKTLLSLLATTGAFLTAEMASAQALPPSVRTPQADQTLGTQVSGNGNKFNITGGLNRGQTLFHSFKDFSIPTGGAANFNNPAGTRDIISRVTGNLFSDLNGTLNSNGANFLLINPNGVVFGPNARLNVGKAFAASTANGVELFDGQGRQFTFGTKPGGDAPLLKINPNVFLNISRLNMGASVPKNPGIVNYGKLQTNNDSQYIGLIGGNVTLDGKYGGGKIVAPGGRVDLGGLNSGGTISTDLQGLVFGGNGLTRSDVLLTNDALVTARANGTLGAVNPLFSNVPVAGSSININANNLSILNSGAKSNTGLAALDNGLAENSGVKTNPGGDININATGRVNLDNANLKNTLRSGAEGKIGDIKINANSLDLINQSILSTNTSGKGNAGNINITTNGDISISGATPQSTKPVTKDSDNSSITSSTDGQGNAGKITIDTQNIGKLSLSNNADISNKISKDAVGNGNDITISAKSLDLSNESSIKSDNRGGKGDAGNINIKTSGDISISGATPQSTAPTTLDSNLSYISSDTFGQGNTGKITIDTQNIGKLSLSNRASISSKIITIDTQNIGKLSLSNRSNISGQIGTNAVGKSSGIKISAREIELRNASDISSTNSAGSKGDAGNIDIKTIGDISILGSSTPVSREALAQNPANLSSITSTTSGQGNAGKITIDTQDRGKLLLSNTAFISSAIGSKGVGNGGEIAISAREIALNNGSAISSSNLRGKGDAGNINIKTSGDISISGFTPDSTSPVNNVDLSSISSDTLGQGNAGKITIDTQNRGKLLLSNTAFISSAIYPQAVGNGGGITIAAREIALSNGSNIESKNRGGKGDAGSIDLKTSGDISISGSTPESTAPITANSNVSRINSSTGGQGNAGKININTQNLGKLSLSNNAIISTDTSKDAVGNGGDITIAARELDLRNEGLIVSPTFGKSNAGNIDIKTIGDISLSNGIISGSTDGQGNAGKITIDTQDRGRLLLSNSSSIFSSVNRKGVGNGNTISISAKEVDLQNQSFISSATSGKGDAGNIIIDTKAVDLQNRSFIDSSTLGKGDAGNIDIKTTDALKINDGSLISTLSVGQGKAGDILLASDRITLNNGNITSQSGGATGGNIQINTQDFLLLRNSSNIATNAESTNKNGNGGNITINSPLIIALPGNNDIAADAVGGNGGKVDITSQGLFGIKYRPKGQDSLFTNDITASSTFGQSGTVNISTPGTDPGKDSTQLPNVPTDASNQIAQTCGASRENKFVVAGRGGIPANANDPLTSDVVWQDARGTNSQPTASSATTDPTKLAPPATGLVFDGKGKATLIAAGTEGQPTGTSVVCNNSVKK
jgi:filamentous hemagglutinin family protein